MNQDATTAAQIETKTPAAARRRWIALIALLVVTVAGVLAYWRYAEIYPSTDNAYTGADIVRVAPLVTGPVTYVYVADDDKVTVDDPLFDIDSTPYEAALRNARAQFDAAASAAGTAGDDLKNAAAELESKRSDLGDAIAKYREAKTAQHKGDAPSQALTDALKGWHDALTAYGEAHTAFSAAQDKKITVTTPTVQLRAASAQLDKTTEDWVRTHVVAPGTGWLANVSLRPGTGRSGRPPRLRPHRGRFMVGRCQLQGNRSRPHQAGPTGDHQPRYVSGAQARRHGGEHQRRLRLHLLGAAA